MKTKTPLKFSPCGDSAFNYADQDEVAKYRINTFNCLNDDQNFELQGNFYRDDMLYVELKLWKCQNATTPGKSGPGVTPGVTCRD